MQSSATVIIGGSRTAREDAVRERIASCEATHVVATRPADWPFVRWPWRGVPSSGSMVVVARGIDGAFPDAQTGGTRLVLTQSTYQMQRWLDWIDARGDVALVADAHGSNVRHQMPEALAGRGPWSRIDLVDLGADDSEPDTQHAAAHAASDVSLAFTKPQPQERLALCRRAAASRPDDAVAQLAVASAFMEVGDLDAAQPASERATELAHDWEATHYELGKLLLRRDDIEHARDAFAEAGRLMPTFSAAFSNLGATLGELDRRDEALDAFHQALRYDPNGYSILNNIGVVSRELGRLDQAEQALQRATTLAPEFVFGHYNLGHTRFLMGKYRAAVAAYEEGQRRDPEKNVRQACRLAVVRLAAGDPDGSLRDWRAAIGRAPADDKPDLLAEAQEILWALLTTDPSLPGWKRIADAVESELRGA